MPISTYILSSNIMSQRKRLDTIADNVANVNTAGYKRQSLDFKELVSRQQGDKVASFAHHNGTRFAFVQGGLTPTNNPLDVALIGDGFFAIEAENGETHYTRNGHFTLDATGQIVDDLGRAVLDANGAAINIPSDSTEIVISSDGTVSNQNGVISSLAVFDFEDKLMLERRGNSGFVPIEQEAILAEKTKINQGFIENSNVSGVQETVKMTELARKYESTAKTINSLEDLEQRAIRSLPSIQ